MTRVLIVSNNPLSYTQHNSKTILSLIDNESDFSLAQIYFNSGTPSYKLCKYYRISDKQIIQSLKKRNYLAGEQVLPNDEVILSNQLPKINQSDYLKRLLREFAWKAGRLDYERLFGWIDDFDPEVLFFMAGDCVFAYDIVSKILDHRNSLKSTVYITDDYILPRVSLSLFFWIRRSMLLKRMRVCLSRSDLFITISQKMRCTYKYIFSKDSIVYANTPAFQDKPETEYISNQFDNKVVFTYAGGLHYNRWKTLGALANAIHKYNNSHSRKAELRIYSASKLTKCMLKVLCIDGASIFCGQVSPEEINKIIASSDVNVHAESFDRQCIVATRLSFSTKIYEYLAAGRCVLAIGSKEIASMEYLTNCAECVYGCTLYSHLSQSSSSVQYR